MSWHLPGIKHTVPEIYLRDPQEASERVPAYKDGVLQRRVPARPSATCSS